MAQVRLLSRFLYPVSMQAGGGEEAQDTAAYVR